MDIFLEILFLNIIFTTHNEKRLSSGLISMGAFQKTKMLEI